MEFIAIIIVFVIILTSIILHEICHGLVAYWLGDDTAKIEGRLTINPIRHIDPVMSVAVPFLLFMFNAPVLGGAKPVPINKNNLKYGEFGMALVAFAGPLSNFLIALIVYLVGYFTGALYANDGMCGVIIYETIVINLSLMIFNLLPIPPLDGSRILYALAPDGVRAVLDRLEKYGFIIVYVIIFLGGGVLSSLMGGIMDAIFDFFYFLVKYL